MGATTNRTEYISFRSDYIPTNDKMENIYVTSDTLSSKDIKLILPK